MKQIIQNMKTGETILEDVPAPFVRAGHLLIQASRSLVSLGTERMLVEFGNASLIQKARQQPDKVKMVLDKIRSDGVLPTLEAVFNKLNQPLPLGYCNVGRVIEVGAGVTEFQIGDRVASNGPHAELVCVPQKLCARIPDNVSDDDASFTVIGSIGLQGIRLLQPTFGETVVIIGLGLIGLISAQILKANGCRVIGFDFDQSKVELANSLGVIAVNPAGGTDQVKFVEELTSGIGADAVLITASAKTNEIISQAARMSRKRGRVVLVGVIGLELSRAEFYEKELTFQVSCSYGPGRYDEQYEQRGHDYPIGFVRWTEKRNFEAILNAISSRQLDVGRLITERVPLAEYGTIYDSIGKSASIASLLLYDDVVNTNTSVIIDSRSFGSSKGVVAIIGAGNFTSATVLPALKPLKAKLKYIVSAGGLTASTLAKRAGVAIATTDYREVLSDNDVDLVMITTRHNLHAPMVIDALKAGKNVFVEKPLCLNKEELAEIERVYLAPCPLPLTPTLTVGFNRRFAPFAQKMKSLLGQGVVNIVTTMNAGFIPANSWVHDLEVGGGRIIGEACHFIDLCNYLTGSRVVAVCMNALGTAPQENSDNVSIVLRYANGSNAVINYFANGSKAYSKERVEVHSQERSLIMDNWRILEGHGFKGFSHVKGKQDKGHADQFRLLLERIISGGEPLIPFDDIINTTMASFAAITSLKEGRWVEISEI
ncbi:MAG: bi-domain-containing oxidoreductase [Desulfuromonadaceae bacterium]|nr:bi-domain-containing oxidoreductase [Desulfuromonadaceae bacterium]MDD2848563.1 bi-domain-containing oxidoreductase [Desulfuromonadaceae bacterium]MDD4131535.1 bi-domain-containing oxidoreductase [Desulfuromonadaceae bacterium]